MFLNSCRGWLCAVVSAAVLTTGAYADELLIVDLSVADQVTISATEGLSSVTISGGDPYRRVPRELLWRCGECPFRHARFRGPHERGKPFGQYPLSLQRRLWF